MKTKQYNSILRNEYPKWSGWKILDFYNSININIEDTSEKKLILVLEENFYLIKQLEKCIRRY